MYKYIEETAALISDEDGDAITIGTCDFADIFKIINDKKLSADDFCAFMNRMKVDVYNAGFGNYQNWS